MTQGRVFCFGLLGTWSMVSPRNEKTFGEQESRSTLERVCDFQLAVHYWPTIDLPKLPNPLYPDPN